MVISVGAVAVFSGSTVRGAGSAVSGIKPLKAKDELVNARVDCEPGPRATALVTALLVWRATGPLTALRWAKAKRTALMTLVRAIVMDYNKSDVFVRFGLWCNVG